MKNYISILLLLISSLCSLWGQNVLCDSLRVYDTVTDYDSCYLFAEPKPCITPVMQSFIPGNVMVQKYVSSGSITVYGVAITFNSRYNTPVLDNCPYLHARLMTNQGQSTINSHYTVMQDVDTVTLNHSHPRFCWFEYNNNKSGCENDSNS